MIAVNFLEHQILLKIYLTRLLRVKLFELIESFFNLELIIAVSENRLRQIKLVNWLWQRGVSIDARKKVIDRKKLLQIRLFHHLFFYHSKQVELLLRDFKLDIPEFGLEYFGHLILEEDFGVIYETKLPPEVRDDIR